jgi:hypothetical protein
MALRILNPNVMEASALCPGRFKSGDKVHGTHCTGDSANRRTGQNAVVKRQNPCNYQEPNLSYVGHTLVAIPSYPGSTYCKYKILTQSFI